MSKKSKRRGRNPGWFRKGFDARRHVGFTAEQCRKGYQAARAKCDADAARAAWFWRMIRGFYRARGSWHPNEERRKHGPKKDGRRAVG